MPISDIPFQQTQQRSPLGQTDWTGNTVTTTYDPRLLNDFWAQVDQRQNQRNVYGTAAQNAYNAMTGPGSDPRTGLNPMVAGVSPTSVQTGYSRAGFQAIPGANDFSGERQRVEDSLYDRFASRADTRFGQQQTALENQLRDMGFGDIGSGNEGVSNAMRDFNFAKNDAYEGAARDAVAGGGAEQSRMLADALRIRGQQGAEGQQDLSNFNTAMGQNFGQRLQAGSFANQGRGQQFGENMGASGQAQNWLQTAGNQLPQGTMLPNFDLGMRNIDEGQANQNERNAWLAQLFGPALTDGLGALFGNGGGSGGGGMGGLGSLISSGLGGLFGGNGSGSWLDGLTNPAMDPSGAYGPDSGWGNDIPTDWFASDPSWVGDYWN